ncbi:MAG: YdcF family protein [Bacteriovoracaceae bacterium]|nr:YdcF family protein [Bacteriovoracaceae bacterium]
MFSKKYVFETRYTRSKRLVRNVFLSIVAIGLASSLLTIYLPMYAQKQKQASAKAFYQKAPDVIAVFTGDSGRIEHALKLAEKHPSAKLFITGVYVKNNLKTLLVNQGANLSVEEYIEQESHHIEIDYLARNTVENGLATIHYAQKLPAVKDILVISSDYHILRVNLILETLRSSGQNLNFHYDAIESDYTEWRNIKILLKEVYKLFKTSTFLLFWDKESPIPN